MIALCRSMVLISRDTQINRQWKSSDTQARQSTLSWSGGVSGLKRSPLPCHPVSPSCPLAPPSPPQPLFWQSWSWRGKLRRLLKVEMTKKGEKFNEDRGEKIILLLIILSNKVSFDVEMWLSQQLPWFSEDTIKSVNPNENFSKFHQYSKKITQSFLQLHMKNTHSSYIQF